VTTCACVTLVFKQEWGKTEKLNPLPQHDTCEIRKRPLLLLLEASSAAGTTQHRLPNRCWIWARIFQQRRTILRAVGALCCEPLGVHPFASSTRDSRRIHSKEENSDNNKRYLCAVGSYFFCASLLRVRLSPVRESGFLLRVYGSPLALRHGRDEPCAKWVGHP